MQKGLVPGKFMPFYNGHIQLIEFAIAKCSNVDVLLCSTYNEQISGAVRSKWLNEYFGSFQNIDILHLYYDEKDLPGTSECLFEVSYLWAQALKVHFPDVDCLISSEPSAEILANNMGIKFIFFEIDKKTVPVSNTQIRLNPYLFWDFIPNIVREYYYRKVCVVGTELTGKSTLVRQLASYFKSDYVTDAKHDICNATKQCTFDDLKTIAESHARQIVEKDKNRNKILFVDTNVCITKSYANFLFSRELSVEDWILEANRFDLYLYLENDAPFVQDGMRLSKEERNRLDLLHKEEFDYQQKFYYSINGSWEERFLQALKIIKHEFIPTCV